MKIIGIIGPPCSGKSTVAGILQSMGAIWINADLIARSQLEVPEVIAEIHAAFGDSVLQDDGTLSRSAIADLVFGPTPQHAEHLSKLESIIHPRTRQLIRESIQHARADGVAMVVLDVPLLLESGWESWCDEVWCLQVPSEQHAKLLRSRDWDLEELQRREQRQLPWATKRDRSDWVLVNDSTPEQLRERIERRLQAN